MKNNELHITFHNPNTKEETAKFLTELIATIAVENALRLNNKGQRKFQDHDLSLLSKSNVI